MEEVSRNPYVNRLNHSYPTEVVGFYDRKFSSDRVRKATEEPVNAPFKMIREVPGLLPFLLGARKGAPFILELCEELR